MRRRTVLRSWIPAWTLLGAPALRAEDDFPAAAKDRLVGNFIAPRPWDLYAGGMRSYYCNWETSWNILDRNGKFEKTWQRSKFTVSLTSEGARVSVENWSRGKAVFHPGFSTQSAWAYWYSCQSIAARDRTRSRDARDALLAVMRTEPLGTEVLNGRTCLVYRFSVGKLPRKNEDIRRSANTAGRMWFDAEDKVLVRVEGEYTKEVPLTSFPYSGIHKGTKWKWEHTRIGGEWLPMRWELDMPGIDSVRHGLRKYFDQELWLFSGCVKDPSATEPRAPVRPQAR